MQGSVEETYKNDQLFPKGTGEQPVQSGAILLDPHNGGIRALAGEEVNTPFWDITALSIK